MAMESSEVAKVLGRIGTDRPVFVDTIFTKPDGTTKREFIDLELFIKTIQRRGYTAPHDLPDGVAVDTFGASFSTICKRGSFKPVINSHTLS